MKGNGRAFCAGGDVVALYRLMNEGIRFLFLNDEFSICSTEVWDYGVLDHVIMW